LGNPFKIGELTYLLQGTDIGPSDRVLDIGCGKGVQTQVIAQRSHCAVGIDLSSSAIKAAEALLSFSKLGRRVRFLAGDLHEDNSLLSGFDHIFSISVIEHVKEYLALLKRAYHLLNRGGKIHISVDSLGTIKNQMLLKKHRDDHSVNVYFSVETVKESLSKAGFSGVTAYPIFVSSFARDEFSRRIQVAGMYGGNFLWRYRTFRRLMQKDIEHYGGSEGIFLIAHGEK
jgi:predicted TPR repeat methyltransferase